MWRLSLSGVGQSFCWGCTVSSLMGEGLREWIEVGEGERESVGGQINFTHYPVHVIQNIISYIYCQIVCWDTRIFNAVFIWQQNQVTCCLNLVFHFKSFIESQQFFTEKEILHCIDTDNHSWNYVILSKEHLVQIKSYLNATDGNEFIIVIHIYKICY